VRLEAVRKELRALERDDEGTVSSVAHNWGFVHLGRFAAQYRDRFGEPPSTTRHR
jgi:AraC-like DNA-binding protein